jgi:formate/nitrite transporter FocA (FNT family)
MICIIQSIYTRVDKAVVVVAQKTEYDVSQDPIDFFLLSIMAQLLLAIGL